MGMYNACGMSMQRHFWNNLANTLDSKSICSNLIQSTEEKLVSCYLQISTYILFGYLNLRFEIIFAKRLV